MTFVVVDLMKEKISGKKSILPETTIVIINI